MQYKVPQNIDLEDKIIGSLTLIQFMYLMTGGVIGYVTFNYFTTEVFLITGLPAILFSLCLTFVKVQDQPFLKFMTSLLLYIFRPKDRVWYKETKQVHTKRIEKKKVEKVEENPEISTAELERLAHVLDSRSTNNIPKTIVLNSKINKNENVKDIFSPSKNQNKIVEVKEQ